MSTLSRGRREESPHTWTTRVPVPGMVVVWSLTGYACSGTTAALRARPLRDTRSHARSRMHWTEATGSTTTRSTRCLMVFRSMTRHPARHFSPDGWVWTTPTASIIRNRDTLFVHLLRLLLRRLRTVGKW